MKPCSYPCKERERERDRERRSLKSRRIPRSTHRSFRKSHDYQARDRFLALFSRRRQRKGIFLYATLDAADNSPNTSLGDGFRDAAGVLKSEISHGRIFPRECALLPRISRTRALFRIGPQQQCQSEPPSRGNETVTSRYSTWPETGRDRHTRCNELVLVHP